MTKSSFARSFVPAAKGVVLVARGRNFRVMIGCAVVAFSAGVVVGLSRGEWAAVAGMSGAVLAVEAVNTAIERVADAVDTEPNPLIGAAKDVAAGASLIISITAAAVGALVFWPR